MKRFLGILAVMFGFTMVAVEIAEAARVGGGRSAGRQSTGATQQAAPAQKAAPAQQQAAPPAQQASGMSRWLGPLAGLAAGFGIASLLSSMGLGGAMASMISSLLMVALLAGGAFLIYRLLTRGKNTQQAPLQYAGAGAGNPSPRIEPQVAQPQPAPFTGNAAPGSLAATIGGAAAAPATAASGWPADFDAAEFERQALLNFQRVQAANDAGDAARCVTS